MAVINVLKRVAPGLFAFITVASPEIAAGSLAVAGAGSVAGSVVAGSGACFAGSASSGRVFSEEAHEDCTDISLYDM